MKPSLIYDTVTFLLNYFIVCGVKKSNMSVFLSLTELTLDKSKDTFIDCKLPQDPSRNLHWLYKFLNHNFSLFTVCGLITVVSLVTSETTLLSQRLYSTLASLSSF